MLPVSDGFIEMFNNPLCWAEVKVEIDGNAYGPEDINSVSTNAQMYGGSEPGIGGVVSRTIDLSLRRYASFSKGAEIKLYLRYTDGSDYTTWLPKGRYYISKRKRSTTGDGLQIEGYDAIVRMERGLWRCIPDTESYSWNARQVVNDICYSVGLGIEQGTQELIWNGAIYNEQAEEEPEEGQPTIWHGLKLHDLIMLPARDVMGHIAAASGGNFIMSDYGTLRLAKIIPNNSGGAVQNVGGATDTFDFLGRGSYSWTGVRFIYDGMPDIAVGDSVSGRELVATCPFATSEMAQSVLSDIDNYLVTPFVATRVVLNPAVELGDMIHIGTHDDAMYNLTTAVLNTTFGTLCRMDVSDPGFDEDELEHGERDGTLIINMVYNNLQLGQRIYYYPVDYQYHLSNPYLDRSEDNHQIIYRSLNETITGTMEDTTVTRQEDYAIALDLDKETGILDVISVDSFTEDSSGIVTGVIE